MGKVLSEDAVRQFRGDGFCDPIRVLSVEQANAIRARLEAQETANGGPLKGSLRFKSHLLFKWQADLIRHPRILDAVEDLIGPDIMCWTTNWWIKPAHSPSFVSWHQDSHYWGLDTDRLVTVWVALSPATVESGCMRMIPGSHRGPDLPHRDTFHEHNMLTRGQEIAVDVDEDAAVDIEVGTGEAALFAFRIAHASHPNRSDDRRIALAIRYIPPDARQVAADWDSAALVRGRDPFGHFEHEPEPREDFDPIAVDFHRRAEEQQRRILYRGTDWEHHRT
ncbi:MAG: phytanoyl-CoA dioxygenase family protein [Ectothiorhodospiraceae bacterium]|nr:phytanoyl-CoA dioxygenase family protein [Ectothiorhodospiraceae bacterium]